MLVGPLAANHNTDLSDCHVLAYLEPTDLPRTILWSRGLQRLADGCWLEPHTVVRVEWWERPL